MFPRLSCVCLHLEMWAEVKVHPYTMRARTFVSVAVCVSRKLRPCPSYSGRRDRNNSVHWRSLHKGVGVVRHKFLQSYNYHLTVSMHMPVAAVELKAIWEAAIAPTAAC